MIGSLYLLLNVNENKLLRHLKETIPKIQNEKGGKNIILGMDHNLDLLKSHVHQSTQSLIDIIDIMARKKMHPTITRPTRITNTTATLIDNIFTDDNLFQSFNSCILIEDISDHLPAITLLKQTKILDKKPIQFKSRCLTDDKLKIVKNKLHRVDWIGEYNTNDVNINFVHFIQIINEKMDEVVQEKMV